MQADPEKDEWPQQHGEDCRDDRLHREMFEAYLKARPSVRRRFNVAVLEAVDIRDRKIGRVEFSEVLAPLSSLARVRIRP